MRPASKASFSRAVEYLKHCPSWFGTCLLRVIGLDCGAPPTGACRARCRLLLLCSTSRRPLTNSNNKQHTPFRGLYTVKPCNTERANAGGELKLKTYQVRTSRGIRWESYVLLR